MPASLEALDRHIGLPPSLLRKCQEVQLEDGITRVEQSLENAENFSQYCRDILSEVRISFIALFLDGQTKPGIGNGYAGSRGI